MYTVPQDLSFCTLLSYGTLEIVLLLLILFLVLLCCWCYSVLVAECLFTRIIFAIIPII